MAYKTFRDQAETAAIADLCLLEQVSEGNSVRNFYQRKRVAIVQEFESDLERANSLRSVLVSCATGGTPKEAGYQSARIHLLETTVIQRSS